MVQPVRERPSRSKPLGRPLVDRCWSLTVTRVSTTKPWAEFSLVWSNAALGAALTSLIVC